MNSSVSRLLKPASSMRWNAGERASSRQGLEQRMLARQFGVAIGADHQQGAVLEFGGQEGEQAQRGGVGPVQVLEDQQQRRALRRAAPEADDRVEQAEARLRGVAASALGCSARQLLGQFGNDAGDVAQAGAERLRRIGVATGCAGSCGSVAATASRVVRRALRGSAPTARARPRFRLERPVAAPAASCPCRRSRPAARPGRAPGGRLASACRSCAMLLLAADEQARLARCRARIVPRRRARLRPRRAMPASQRPLRRRARGRVRLGLPGPRRLSGAVQPDGWRRHGSAGRCSSAAARPDRRRWRRPGH